MPSAKHPSASREIVPVNIAIEFLHAAHLLGDTAVATLARGIEQIGYDEIDLLEHVTVGHPTPDRPAGHAEPNILEPLVTLGMIAGVTSRIGLGTEVLILPQRQPALVAKQVSTLDVLSGGRVRLGLGVGWQESEYESLGVPFRERGRRMDESIQLLRAYWTEASVTFDGTYFQAEAMGMDPKPRQPGGPPLWIGGDSNAALRRVGKLGDGWMALMDSDVTAESAREKISTIRSAAEEAGRDPATIGFQVRLSDPTDLDNIPRRIEHFRELGFTWVTISMPFLEQSGFDSVEAQLDILGRIHERIRAA